MARKNNLGGLAILAVVIIGAFVFSGGLKFIGGSVTSLSYVNFVSNNASINGPGWLATINLDGRGQNLTSFSAHQMNSSYSAGGTPVSIDTEVTHYGYTYQYTTAPTSRLYFWNVTYLNVAGPTLTINIQQCGFGVYCTISSQSNNYVWMTGLWCGTCNSYSGNNNVASSIKGYFEEEFAQACYGLGQNAYPIQIASGSLSSGSGTYAEEMACVQFKAKPLASLYTASTFINTFNATITLTNGTTRQSVSLNERNGAGSVPGQLYVQLTDYPNSGYNINQQLIPTVAIVNGKAFAVNPISVQSALSGAESPTIPSGALSFLGQTKLGQNVYSNETLNNFNKLNTEASLYLTTPVNKSNPFNALNVASFNQNNPVATLDLTSNPPFYARIQLLAKFATLGIGIPVGKETIISLSPSPLETGSATAIEADFTVQNTGTASAPVYINGTCGSMAFSSYSSPVTVAVGKTGTVPVIIHSPINPTNSTKESVSCSANAYSQFGLGKSPVYTFTLYVKAQCPAGTIYIDPNTCKPIQPVTSVTTICSTAGCTQPNTTSTTIPYNPCRTGYTWNVTQQACVPNNTCPSGQILNTSKQPPACEVPPPPKVAWWEYVILGGIVVAIIAFATRGRGRHRRRR